MHANHRRALVAVTILAVILGGCASGAADSAGSDDADTAATAPAASVTDEQTATTEDRDTEAAEPDDHARGNDTFAFGEPADPADADRTVQVRATDQMTFEPATVEVGAGEAITFEVENVGQIPHDFTLGDDHAQQEHAREMKEMDDAEMAHADPNTITLGPGETAAITWRFHDAGEVLYGCHQPGHYDAGMVGSIDVTP